VLLVLDFKPPIHPLSSQCSRSYSRQTRNTGRRHTPTAQRLFEAKHTVMDRASPPPPIDERRQRRPLHQQP